MTEEDLYRAIILDHTQNPRHYGLLQHPSHRQHRSNPLCGDEITLSLQVDDRETIVALGFEASGCAISQASASMLSQQLAGKTLEQSKQLLSNFRAWMKGAPSALELGDLVALSGVRSYPVRVQCALLAWATLEEALS